VPKLVDRGHRLDTRTQSIGLLSDHVLRMREMNQEELTKAFCPHLTLESCGCVAIRFNNLRTSTTLDLLDTKVLRAGATEIATILRPVYGNECYISCKACALAHMHEAHRLIVDAPFSLL